jgi:hypothetical protein
MRDKRNFTYFGNDFMKRPLEERNIMVQKKFDIFMETLRRERQYIPVLIKNPKTGELGIKLTAGNKDAGTYFPSTGPERGEKIRKRKGTLNSFRSAGSIGAAFGKMFDLCYKDFDRMKTYYEWWLTEMKKCRKKENRILRLRKIVWFYKGYIEQSKKCTEGYIQRLCTRDTIERAEIPGVTKRILRDGPGISSPADVQIEIESILKEIEKQHNS